jgi:hypothetical protein
MATIDDAPMSTRDVLQAEIAAHPGITERRLGELTGFSTSKLTPSRIRLWEAGEIEPTSDIGWKHALANRVKDVGWQVVESERRQAVGARARTRAKRNAKSIEARAARIVEDLRNKTVHRLVMKMLDGQDLSVRHARRSEQALRKQEALRKREAKRSAEANAADADMQRKLALLWRARSTVAAIDNHLIEERARVARGEPRRVADASWLIAFRDVLMILKSFGGIWDNLRGLGDDMPCPVCGAQPTREELQLRGFAVDADAEEDDHVVDGEVVPQ